MKQSETKNKHTILMYLCFIMGGLCILVSIYMLIFNTNILLSRRNKSITNFTKNNNTLRPHPQQSNPFNAINLITNLIILSTGITLISSGISLNSLITKKIKKDITDMLLTPEEKKVIEILEKRNGEITQNEITQITNYSRVKVYRITKSLEEKKLIQKIKYGQTNKIILK